MSYLAYLFIVFYYSHRIRIENIQQAEKQTKSLTENQIERHTDSQRIQTNRGVGRETYRQVVREKTNRQTHRETKRPTDNQRKDKTDR